jgi:hypothetical protein
MGDRIGTTGCSPWIGGSRVVTATYVIPTADICHNFCGLVPCAIDEAKRSSRCSSHVHDSMVYTALCCKS